MSGGRTPGPWSVSHSEKMGGDHGGRWHIFEHGDFIIVPAPGEAGPIAIAAGPANARLIAAAPELLEALTVILGKLSDGKDAPGHSHDVAGVWDADNHPDIAGKQCEWCAQWSRAHAAVAKATAA